MPVPTPSDLGPLGHLIGDWEGDAGLDVAYSHAKGEIIETPYREKTSFKPFGPVENGRQVLFGLDYRTAAWRHGEDDPFHTEIGYWLWDAQDSQVMRCFMVPRGTVVIAGGTVRANSTTIVMHGQVGATAYGILNNPYLDQHARTLSYTVTIAVHHDGEYSYDSDTTIQMTQFPEPYSHTDRNTLKRVGA